MSRALPVMTLNTPGGMPARSAELGQSEGRERRLAWRACTTKVQPAASAGPALRVIMAFGKFHGVMAATTPTGCLMTTMRGVGQWRGNGLAIDALGLLGEELDEGRAIGDLAAGFGQGLALLGGHDLGQVLLVVDHQVEPFAQDRGALLGGLGGPARAGLFGGVDGLAGLVPRRASGHHGDRRAVGRIGDLDASGPGFTHLPAM